jgi:two-component sensor histidine kinase
VNKPVPNWAAAEQGPRQTLAAAAPSTARARTSTLPLRRWLLLMCAALLAPVLVLMGLLLREQYEIGVTRAEAQLLSEARGMALRGEMQVSQASATLEALSVRRSLQTGQFKAFEQEARQVAADLPGWFVLIERTSENQLFNTRVPEGAPLPRGGFPADAWRALEGGRTRVSGLTTSRLLNRPIVAIDTPAVIDDRLYAVSYVQEPSVFQPLVNSVVKRPGWIGVILDRRATIIARSLNPDRTIGRSATPDLAAAALRQQEGLIRSRTLEGEPSILAFSRAPIGWVFVVAMPQKDIQAAAWRAVGSAAGNFALLLGGALLAAAIFSRRILTDLQRLESVASQIGQSDAEPAQEPAAFAETEAVRQALTRSAERLRQQEAAQAEAMARQRTLVNELNHRVKNNLATVQSLAKQSLRDAPPAARDRFEGRLLALARAHDLLTRDSWRGADLRELARAVLEPYSGASVRGPSFWVSSYAAVSLTLVLHELATNAAKYGAIARGGVLTVDWEVDETDLSLHWAEASDPPPEQGGGEDGFGSRLIRSSVERELGGRVERTWQPQGLSYRLTLPLSRRLVGSEEGPGPVDELA